MKPLLYSQAGNLPGTRLHAVVKGRVPKSEVEFCETVADLTLRLCQRTGNLALVILCLSMREEFEQILELRCWLQDLPIILLPPEHSNTTLCRGPRCAAAVPRFCRQGFFRGCGGSGQNAHDLWQGVGVLLGDWPKHRVMRFCLMVEKRQRASNSASTIAARYDALSRNMREIVASMQFQDITRQRIERSTEALEKIAGGSLTEDKAGAEEKTGFCGSGQPA